MTPDNREGILSAAVRKALETVDETASSFSPELSVREVGTLQYIGAGIAGVSGLPRAASEELLRLPGGITAMVFNVDPGEAGVILLNRTGELKAGDEVTGTRTVLEVPVGEEVLGRVVDALGRPLDGSPYPATAERRAIERDAPGIMERAPVKVPLQTGFKVVDALVPIGRGQRELIVGDRQTGKTAIAVDTIINQRGKDVVCIYCSIGREAADAASVVADLRRFGATDYSTVVVATGEDPPGLRFVAPYAATSMAEYFLDRGRDVLIVYDDLTRHARAYRELSLLLRRPPGREAFPGDIFYIHSRLLERSTHLRSEGGGGSLTALPIVETEAQNIAAYIPTNLISITDGQIYLSPDLFQKGILPAVDVGRSVSRVGGKTQLPAYREVAGDLRLSYSQFQELESFARFGTRLEEETRRTLERGRRVREVLKQGRYDPMTVSEQVSVLLAVTRGVFDELPIDGLKAAEDEIRHAAGSAPGHLFEKIESGGKLGKDQWDELVRHTERAVRGRQAGG
jgi:F-type H+-transporting ATPase subunit alpha